MQSRAALACLALGPATREGPVRNSLAQGTRVEAVAQSLNTDAWFANNKTASP
jgi:hypothetical protein